MGHRRRRLVILEYIEWMEGYNWSIATTTRRQCNFSLNKIKISFPRLSRGISFGVEPIYLAPENRMPLLSEQGANLCCTITLSVMVIITM